MQNTKSKINSFSISPASIQGKLLISFITTISLLLILMVVLIAGYQRLLKRENYINIHIGAIKFFSIKLGNGVNRSYNDALSYATYKQPHYRNEILNILRDDIIPNFDSLQQIGKSSDDVYTKNSLFELEEQIVKLKELYNGLSLIPPDQIELFTKSKINPLMNKLNKEIDILTTTQIKKEHYLHTRQRNDEMTFYVLVAVLLTIMLTISFAVSNRIIKTVMKNLDLLDSYTEVLKHGNLPENVRVTQDELQDILDDIAYLTDNLNRVKSFAQEVGKGNFDTDITVFNNEGELGTALAEMRRSLKEISVQEKNRNWLNVGVSQMSEVMRKHAENMHQLADDLLAQIIDYSNSSQGAIFILNDKKVLEAIAYYAYGKKKYIQQEIEIGQGLLGSTFQDGITQIITEIPKDYLQISSGLGKAAPKSLVLVPLKYQDTTLGIMEIASFEVYGVHHIEFFELVANILASTLTNLHTNSNTKLLLAEAQNNAIRIHEQENLLRIQTENLEKIREELLNNYEKIENENAMLRQTLTTLNNHIINIDKNGVILYINIQAAGIFDTEPDLLLHKNLFKLLPTIQEDLLQMEESEQVEKIAYQNISSGRGRIVPYQTTITKIIGGKQAIYSLYFAKAQEEIVYAKVNL
jgi:GAF domain-containing protein